jgi:hypothetical protein
MEEQAGLDCTFAAILSLSRDCLFMRNNFCRANFFVETPFGRKGTDKRPDYIYIYIYRERERFVFVS